MTLRFSRRDVRRLRLALRLAEQWEETFAYANTPRHRHILGWPKDQLLQVQRARGNIRAFRRLVDQLDKAVAGG